MKIEELMTSYPRLYHMAESGSWPSIKANGLLSTSALLDLFEIKGDNRLAIESRRRPECITIRHPTYGTAIIRDQKPLHEGALQKLLDGMSTSEFYQLLNGRVFFWARKERLERLLNARAYVGKSHTVLTVDTLQLLKNHADKVSLSPINSGAIFGTGRRGAYTFKRIKDYPFEEMKKKKHEDAIVEFAVDYAVKDISSYTIKVEEWFEGRPIKTIWERNP